MPLNHAETFYWNGFNLLKTVLAETQANYTHTGTFSRVTATFYLRRELGTFILDVYIPLILYCAVAYGSCWIEITAAPGRIALGVTILLTMVTTARNARENLPPVSYIHTLDIFITVCTVFVTATFVEFIVVNYFYFKEKRSKAKITKRLKSMKRRKSYERRHNVSHAPNDDSTMISSFTSDDVQVTVSSTSSKAHDVNVWSTQAHHDHHPHFFRTQKSWTIRTGNCLRNILLFRSCRRTSDTPPHKRMTNGEELAYEIDRLARMFFPVAFLIFNVIYWITIIVLSSQNV